MNVNQAKNPAPGNPVLGSRFTQWTASGPLPASPRLYTREASPGARAASPGTENTTHRGTRKRAPGSPDSPELGEKESKKARIAASPDAHSPRKRRDTPVFRSSPASLGHQAEQPLPLNLKLQRKYTKLSEFIGNAEIADAAPTNIEDLCKQLDAAWLALTPHLRKTKLASNAPLYLEGVSEALNQLQAAFKEVPSFSPDQAQSIRLVQRVAASLISLIASIAQGTSPHGNPPRASFSSPPPSLETVGRRRGGKFLHRLAEPASLPILAAFKLTVPLATSPLSATGTSSTTATARSPAALPQRWQQFEADLAQADNVARRTRDKVAAMAITATDSHQALERAKGYLDFLKDNWEDSQTLRSDFAALVDDAIKDYADMVPALLPCLEQEEKDSIISRAKKLREQSAALLSPAAPARPTSQASLLSPDQLEKLDELERLMEQPITAATSSHLGTPSTQAQHHFAPGEQN